MRNNNRQFYIDSHQNIYKSTNNNYLLKLSPWSAREDRRMFNFELDKTLKKISFSSAMEKLNLQFNNIETEWNYQGKQYKTQIGSTFATEEGLKHQFHYVQKTLVNECLLIDFNFYLCLYHGKIYWLSLNSYYPRARLYKFVNIDTPPSFNDFAQWTHVKNCQLIYCYNEQNNKWEKKIKVSEFNSLTFIL